MNAIRAPERAPEEGCPNRTHGPRHGRAQAAAAAATGHRPAPRAPKVHRAPPPHRHAPPDPVHHRRHQRRHRPQPPARRAGRRKSQPRAAEARITPRVPAPTALGRLRRPLPLRRRRHPIPEHRGPQLHGPAAMLLPLRRRPAPGAAGGSCARRTATRGFSRYPGWRRPHRVLTPGVKFSLQRLRPANRWRTQADRSHDGRPIRRQVTDEALRCSAGGALLGGENVVWPGLPQACGAGVGRVPLPGLSSAARAVP